MPWAILVDVGRARQHLRDAGSRVPGTCHDTLDNVMTQASAVLRRRSSEDVGTVAAVITNAPHCVPCISLVTRLDARRIYAALEQLKTSNHVRLISTECRQCRRATTAHVIGE
jgi:hypothetical protein